MQTITNKQIGNILCANIIVYMNNSNYLIHPNISFSSNISRAELYSKLCVLSLLHEVYTTPKPGLVDRNNNGSHLDLNVSLFEKSAFSLESYFLDMYNLGTQYSNSNQKDSYYNKMRNRGVLAENEMFEVTNNINTHKGAIYIFGIISFVLGELSNNSAIPSLDTILKEVALFGSYSLNDDFNSNKKLNSYGYKQYIEYGLTGIRGEVASGLSSMTKYSLPCFKSMSHDDNIQDIGKYALVNLLANIDDGCMISRGGYDLSIRIKEEVAKDIKQGIVDEEYIYYLDKKFIELNLSPGGCADLLSTTYLIKFLEDQNYLYIN